MNASLLKLCSVSALALSITTHAQSLTAFDAVSIREVSESASLLSFPSFEGRRFVMRGPISLLLGHAYSRTTRLVNAPSWVSNEGYEITAVATREPTLDERTTMLRALLADRFKLVARVEDQDTPGYELVLKGAGKLGPQLRKSNIDCDAYLQSLKNGDAAAALPKASNGERPCSHDVRRMSADDNLIVSGGMTMEQLAIELRGSTQPGLIIVDRTGLSGRYELTLRFRRQQTRVEPYVGSVSEVHNALEDDLGLKLQRATVRVPVLVIEHIERPPAN